MLKKMKEMIKNERGLTLIELLAVIVILAIIAAIAVPAIGDVINKTDDRAKLAEASNILSAAKLAMVNGDCGKTTCTQADLASYVDGKLNSADEVTKSGEVWSVTYSKLNDWKSKKFIDFFGASGAGKDYISSNTINETNLNTALAQ